MAMMNKPAFRSIRQFSPVKPVLLFVASRRQTRLTAMSFVSMLALEEDPHQWLRMTGDELQKVMRSVKDDNLRISCRWDRNASCWAPNPRKKFGRKTLCGEKNPSFDSNRHTSLGINVPAHLVIVKGTEFFDGKTSKYVDFPVTDVLQMIGRAGRPQYDDSAVAVVFVQDVKKNFYKKFLYEPFPVESSLLPALPNHVNAEICADSIGSKQQVMEYLSSTYLYRRLFANPSFYGVQDFSAEGLTKFLVSIVDDSICELVQSRCVVADKRSGTIEASPLGKIGSKYYLDHLSIRHFFQKMKGGLTVEQLLQILADCPEYREIPVRHNEDNVNQDLQKLLPIKLPAATTDWGSSHVKTHLLYQAHFSRTQVPVDYLTDQRSILESCIRIVQAMLDFCSVFDWLDTALNVIILLQQIMQARWYTDHPLLCLPNMSAHSIDGLAPFATVPQLQDQLGIYGETDLAEGRIRKNYEARELIQALLKWPILRVSDVRLQSGLQECSITIGLEDFQTARDQRMDKKAYCPKFPKDRTFGWTIVLGEKKSAKILACHKSVSCGNYGNKLVRLSLKAPSTGGDYAFTIFVFSDTYLGIDQEFDFCCIVE
uniref:SEC63 domain-containing protein n=1 Tax=Ditylenchus dipsaci TaxID=166011 RepID=A0A915DVJ2_9BILA